MATFFTRYLGPTDHHGSRIKVWTSSGLTAILPYDHAADDAHDAAVKIAARRFYPDAIFAPLVRGTAPDERGNVYVETTNVSVAIDEPLRAELADLGIDHAQYFQGFGTSFTNFTDSVVGIGDSFDEAFENAMEQIGSANDSKLAEAIEQIVRDELPTKKDRRRMATVTKELKEQYRNLSRAERKQVGGFEGFSSRSELYYHVGIRWAGHKEVK